MVASIQWNECIISIQLSENWFSEENDIKIGKIMLLRLSASLLK